MNNSKISSVKSANSGFIGKWQTLSSPWSWPLLQNFQIVPQGQIDCHVDYALVTKQGSQPHNQDC